LAAGRVADAVTSRQAARPLRVGLPRPSGPYKVGTTTLHLVDRARHDPHVVAQPYRELMVNLTYPARDTAGRPIAGWLTLGWAGLHEPLLPDVTSNRLPVCAYG
jgi:hypothetical protein